MEKIKIAPVYFKNKQGFTLVELIVAAVVIGIIAGFSMAGFYGARQRALTNEARAILKLIQSAQKVHYLEVNSYVECTNTSWTSDQETCINNNLHLAIPPGGPSDDVDWDYETLSSNGCAHCRNRANNARMHICIDDEDTSSGICSCP